MSRKTQVYLLAFAAALCVGGVGCSGSNEPAGPAASSGAGAAAVMTSAGAASVAGSPSSSAGAANVAGASPAAGGAPGAAGAAPAAAGSGGAPVGAAGAAASGMFMPLCAGVPVTAAGAAPTKGGTCTATDTQLCYKTCGPQSSGYKSETCTTGIYQEQSGCTFPMESDYSCFKIPSTLDATCPTDIIMANTGCAVAACTPCANALGQYNDSSGLAKSGYCVCQAPAVAGGMGKWSCASTTAWPCPNGKGC